MSVVSLTRKLPLFPCLNRRHVLSMSLLTQKDREEEVCALKYEFRIYKGFRPGCDSGSSGVHPSLPSVSQTDTFHTKTEGTKKENPKERTRNE